MKHKIDWILLIGGIFWASFSVFLDVKSLDETFWFARSGSILVLAAAIVEYRLASFIYEDIFRAQKQTDRKKAAMPNVSGNELVNRLVKSNLTIQAQPSKERKALAITAHLIIVLGTLVWGYGDKWLT